MNNISGNITIALTATLGVLGMSPDDFRPTTVFVYVIVVGAAAFVLSFAVESTQPLINQKLHNFIEKIKLRLNDFMGLGKRHI